MWVLLMLVTYAGNGSANSPTISHVPGFSSKEKCAVAGKQIEEHFGPQIIVLTKCIQQK